MSKHKFTTIAATALLFLGGLASCEDSKSYSELLNEEEHAVNWYLSGQKVCNEIPADSIFVAGEDAPFYKIDQDGYIYMKVIEQGDMNDRPQQGQRIYFRFMRQNLKALYEGQPTEWEGNSEGSGSLGSTSLIYGDNILQSTTIYGEGIQEVLKFLGNRSRVNLVLSSPQGFTTESTTCLPYLYDIRFFKAEY